MSKIQFFSRKHIYKQKAGQPSCRSAYRKSVELFVTYSNTEAHVVYTQTIGILVSQCLVTFEIYQISICQNKARKTLFIMSVSHHTYWTFPRREQYKKCNPTLVHIRNTLQNYYFFLLYTNFSQKKRPKSLFLLCSLRRILSDMNFALRFLRLLRHFSFNSFNL